MSEKRLFFCIEDESKKTKKQVEELVLLLQKGYDVVETFSYKNEHYYVLIKWGEDAVVNESVEKELN